jgi:hypothetical protein
MDNRERVQRIQKSSLLLSENNNILYNNEDDYINILSNCIEDIKLNKDNTDKLYEINNCIQKYILFIMKK